RRGPPPPRPPPSGGGGPDSEGRGPEGRRGGGVSRFVDELRVVWGVFGVGVAGTLWGDVAYSICGAADAGGGRFGGVVGVRWGGSAGAGDYDAESVADGECDCLEDCDGDADAAAGPDGERGGGASDQRAEGLCVCARVSLGRYVCAS